MTYGSILKTFKPFGLLLKNNYNSHIVNITQHHITENNNPNFHCHEISTLK